ncbi:MAG: helix-hairpin-helix domain-containing protein [Planctomycetes bacterium]|nr:helix-hairpin-helix domain-containing protein [Planctomycetota bacterium]
MPQLFQRPTPNAERRTPRLEDLPNVGPSVAGDLRRLGITRPAELRGRNPLAMYRALCRKDGVRHDPCLLDVFMALADFTKTGRAKPWWHFTEKRKSMKLIQGPIAKGRKA